MQRIKKRARKGLSLTEVLVAATLVLSMIGIMSPLTVRVGRVWQSTRQYRLACHELANHMERMTSLGTERCRGELSTLKPSSQLIESLPGVQLRGEILGDQDGTRLLLELEWERGPNAVPLTLIGWLDTEPVRNETSALSSDSSLSLVMESTAIEASQQVGVQP